MELEAAVGEREVKRKFYTIGRMGRVDEQRRGQCTHGNDKTADQQHYGRCFVTEQVS